MRITNPWLHDALELDQAAADAEAVVVDVRGRRAVPASWPRAVGELDRDR